MSGKATTICSCNIDLAAIQGVDQAIEVLGYWPCFHDAEIYKLHFDKSASGNSLDVHTGFAVHRMLEEVDNRGFYKLVDHANITLLFQDVHLQYLNLNHFPDIVIDFSIRHAPASVEDPSIAEVRIVSTGIVELECRSVIVMDVQRKPR